MKRYSLSCTRTEYVVQEASASWLKRFVFLMRNDENSNSLRNSIRDPSLLCNGVKDLRSFTLSESRTEYRDESKGERAIRLQNEDNKALPLHASSSPQCGNSGGRSSQPPYFKEKHLGVKKFEAKKSPSLWKNLKVKKHHINRRWIITHRK